MLLSHPSKCQCEYENLKFAVKSLENDTIGQGNFIHYECLRNVLRSQQICFTNVTNA